MSRPCGWKLTERRIEAAIAGTLKNAAAEIDVRSRRRPAPGCRRSAARSAGASDAAQRHAPTKRCACDSVKTSGRGRRDMVEVGAVVGLLDVAVDELEAVIRIQRVVGARQPLVAIVEVVLLEAVAAPC